MQISPEWIRLLWAAWIARQGFSDSIFETNLGFHNADVDPDIPPTLDKVATPLVANVTAKGVSLEYTCLCINYILSFTINKEILRQKHGIDCKLWFVIFPNFFRCLMDPTKCYIFCDFVANTCNMIFLCQEYHIAPAMDIRDSAAVADFWDALRVLALL